MPEEVKTQTQNEVTGAESEAQLRARISQLVDERIAARGTAQVQVPSTPAKVEKEPLKVNLGGQDFTFDTIEELNAALAKYNDAVLQSITAARNSTLTVSSQTTQDVTPKFTTDEFVKRFSEDPVKGFEYYEQMQYGAPMKTILQGLTQYTQATANQARAMAAYQFRESTPDFPDGDEKAANIVGTIIQNHNLPFTPENLKMAWAYAKEQGLVKPAVQQQQVETQSYGNELVRSMPQNDSNWRRPVAPPTVNRASVDPSLMPDLNKFAGLEPHEMRAILEQSGLV